MDIKRAQEILKSQDGTTITYKERGVVWLNDIDAESGMATITSHRQKLTVPVKDLEEFKYS